MYVNVLPQLILVVFRTRPCANVRMAGPAGSAPQVNVLDLEVKVYSVKKIQDTNVIEECHVLRPTQFCQSHFSFTFSLNSGSPETILF